MRVLIIGAGLTGLVLGRELQSRGAKVTILEKSRGLGGRLATRRIDDQGLDHGCPIFSNESNLRNLLETSHQDFTQQNETLIPLGGMSSLAKILAQGLEVKREVRAKTLQRLGNQWVVTSTEGEQFQSDALIVTAPLPQSLELLDENNLLPHLHSDLRKVSYSKALILLATFEELPSLKPSEGEERCFSMNERHLHSKGFVYDAGPSWSEENFDKSDEALMPELQKKLAKHFNHELSWSKCEVKKWRYSRPVNPLSESFRDLGQNLFLAGDAFAGGQAHGALASAKALAPLLLS